MFTITRTLSMYFMLKVEQKLLTKQQICKIFTNFAAFVTNNWFVITTRRLII